jgi:hypothetical protein
MGRSLLLVEKYLGEIAQKLMEKQGAPGSYGGRVNITNSLAEAEKLRRRGT